MALQVKLVEIMVKVGTNIYRKLFRNYSKGHMILYVEMQKDLYGILKSALLLYMKMVGYLTRAGFKLDPYYPCLMKTIVWG